jgi:hypothetical protein
LESTAADHDVRALKTPLLRKWDSALCKAIDIGGDDDCCENLSMTTLDKWPAVPVAVICIRVGSSTSSSFFQRFHECFGLYQSGYFLQVSAQNVAFLRTFLSATTKSYSNNF